MKPNSRLTILVVEDEHIVAWELTERLRRMGYNVCAAVPTGEEAIRVAQDHRPDLVLMDIMLAGKMDGIEAAQAIRCASGAPVVFCSAYSGEMRTRAERLAPLGFLEKPMDYDRLANLLSNLNPDGARTGVLC